MRSGGYVHIRAPRFPGRWGALIQAQYREEEILQFVGRLRPVYRTGRTPVWFAISSIIPESLIVDEVISLKELADNDEGRLWDGMAFTGGVISDEIISSARPATFTTGARVRRVMNAVGLNQKDGVVETRSGRGMTPVRWRPRHGDWRHAFVASYLPDPVERVREVVRRHVGYRNVEVELMERGHRLPAMTRAPDSVDESLGILTRDDVYRQAEAHSADIGRFYVMGEASTPGEGGRTIEGALPSFVVPGNTSFRKFRDELSAYWALREEHGSRPVPVGGTEPFSPLL